MFAITLGKYFLQIFSAYSESLFCTNTQFWPINRFPDVRDQISHLHEIIGCFNNYRRECICRNDRIHVDDGQMMNITDFYDGISIGSNSKNSRGYSVCVALRGN